MKVRRRTIWITIVVAMFVAAALLSKREGTGERGPGGTLALRRALVALGYDVRTADELPSPPATFVLVTDLRDEEESARLQQWVQAGGRLVVADPEALIVASGGIEPVARIGTIGPASLRPGCASGVAAGVRTLVVAGRSPSLASRAPSAVACFHAARGSFVVAARAGDGQLFVLGSPSPLTNEFVRRGDNIAFAVNLLDAHGPIVFGSPFPAASEAAPRGLWASLPPPGKAVVVQLMVALMLFALVRGRRLGRPVGEDPRVPIPAGELVRATGRLLRSARATAHAGRLMREQLARRVATRLGFGSAALARSRAAELGERAYEALAGPEPATDAELIELGRKIEQARRELEGADR